MKTYLKIKIKSLAEEAKIIKREERKWWKLIGKKEIYDKDAKYLWTKSLYKKDHPLVFGLKNHRLHEVRPECRAANIAYGYLRGRAYKQIENKAYVEPNLERVGELIRKFGSYNILPDYHTAQGRKAGIDKLRAWVREGSAAKAA